MAKWSNLIWGVTAFALGEGNQLSGQTIPWLSQVLYLVAAILIATQVLRLFAPSRLRQARDWLRSWQLRSPIARRQAAPVPVPITDSRAVRIVDIALSPNLTAPSPWLNFRCRGFNGTSTNLKIASASGQITIAGETYHEAVELRTPEELPPPAAGIWVQPFDWFSVTLSVKLTADTKAHFQKVTGSNGNEVKVLFVSVALDMQFDGKEFAVTVPVDMYFHFDAMGAAKGGYVYQIMNTGGRR